ncbi:YkvA family protein [Streptomyces sp. NPDC048349]|uniref:YkvA family protein n=1 Tax=Streptomyces sp. NPDC048349 TaxID=3155486 RepID=UPI00342501B8
MDATIWIALAAAVALGLAITAAVLLVRVLRARRLLLDAGIPLRDKALFWVAVIYTVSPVDLIPDPVYLDDIGVLLLALRSLHAAAAAAATRPAVEPDDKGPIGCADLGTWPQEHEKALAKEPPAFP